MARIYFTNLASFENMLGDEAKAGASRASREVALKAEL